MYLQCKQCKEYMAVLCYKGNVCVCVVLFTVECYRGNVCIVVLAVLCYRGNVCVL